jgi:hypothetical protein
MSGGYLSIKITIPSLQVTVKIDLPSACLKMLNGSKPSADHKNGHTLYNAENAVCTTNIQILSTDF